MIRKILLRNTSCDIIREKNIQYVFIKVNKRCNARCEFCSSWREKEDKIAVDLKNLIDQLVDINPCEVNLSGGEVFIAKYFWKLLEYAGGRLNWSITTNGSSMIPPTIDSLVANNVKRLFISVDSYIYEQNNKSRGISNVLERICEGIAYIREKNYSVTIIINHVVTNLNYSQIYDFLCFFKSMSIDAVNLLPIKDAPDLFLDSEQIRAFYGKIEKCIYDGFITGDFFVNRYYKIFGVSQEDYYCAEVGNYMYEKKNQCLLPYNTIFIDLETGNIYPCDTTIWRENNQQYVMGNMNQTSISDVWEGNVFECFRKSMYPEMMNNCYKYCDPNNAFFEEYYE